MQKYYLLWMRMGELRGTPNDIDNILFHKQSDGYMYDYFITVR
jgi:hypothetical protein